MFDLGMSELLIIGIVALIVIGPRDLPELFRSLGRFTAKLRGMAREFSRAMEAAADEAGAKDMRDVANDLRKVTSPKAMGLDAVREAAASFEKWDPMKTAKPAGKADSKPAAPPPAAEATSPVAGSTPAPKAETAAAMGSNTQALADAQAEKRRAMAEAAAAKKAAAPAPKAAPRAKPAAKVAAAATDAKPKSPRKTTKKSDA